MEKIVVLVTGAGAPGIWGTIESLRNNPDKRPFKIITSDIQNNPVGKYLSDVFYQFPAPEQENYLPALISTINKEKIRVIIPQTTREINTLALHKNEVEATGCRVVVSSFETIRKANDKYLLLEECKSKGVPYPEFRLTNSRSNLVQAIEELGYPAKPVVVKPRNSNGMRGVRVVTPAPLTFEKYFLEKPSGLEIDKHSFLKIFDNHQQFPDLLVSEYLPGDEYSIDVFRTEQDVVVIPRLRAAIRSGISFETMVDLSQNRLIEYSKKLALSLDLKFCFGFQFKRDSSGAPKMLECNPRVQGTMVASTYAGFNMIYYSVMTALGELPSLPVFHLSDRVVFKRYWGGLMV